MENKFTKWQLCPEGMDDTTFKIVQCENGSWKVGDGAVWAPEKGCNESTHIVWSKDEVYEFCDMPIEATRSLANEEDL